MLMARLSVGPRARGIFERENFGHYFYGHQEPGGHFLCVFLEGGGCVCVCVGVCVCGVFLLIVACTQLSVGVLFID